MNYTKALLQYNLNFIKKGIKIMRERENWDVLCEACDKTMERGVATESGDNYCDSCYNKLAKEKNMLIDPKTDVISDYGQMIEKLGGKAINLKWLFEEVLQKIYKVGGIQYEFLGKTFFEKFTEV